MGDPIPVSYSMLPGAIFFPSPAEFLKYYLSGKNNCNTEPAEGFGFIKDLDLYDYQPSELPEMTCYRYENQKTHWLFYTAKGVKESEDGRRIAKSGYWKRVGGTVDVTDDGGLEVLGTITEFRFYLGPSPALRTEWLMHEYALLQDLRASFVLCRVFVQSSVGNSFSKKIFTIAEGVSEVRHIGIQHDGLLLPNLVDAKVQVDNSIDGKSDASGYPSKLNSELDDPAITGPVSASSFELLSGIPRRELVSSQPTPQELSLPNLQLLSQPTLQMSSQLTPGLLSSIVEEDFMELDDLMQ
ncbi:hypothetical protein SLEP1_g21651 [Rubroshorea leprosula]|uniref:NAC domain-containing protein n=1 Tax=Rubroshorea leprosula TaxID=152421 RepID=A0AAV5JFV5_9ROSI|nr:hypothetical protein SLEP1_g21651 [Rubroshorea leprosula]